MSLYRLVFSKVCHLPIGLEHKVYWAIQKLNYDPKACGERRLLELNEINEFRIDAYASA